MADLLPEADILKEAARDAASEFCGCVAAHHTLCAEQLRAAIGSLPAPAYIVLCFEPLYYGLSFFGEDARKHHPRAEQEVFIRELEKTIRQFLVGVVFQPRAVGFSTSNAEPFRIVDASPGTVVIEERGLTKEQEEFVAIFSQGREQREQQFRKRLPSRFDRFRLRFSLGIAGWLEGSRRQPPIEILLDSIWLVAALRRGMADVEYGCPESLLRNFADGIVTEAYRIRNESLSGIHTLGRRYS